MGLLFGTARSDNENMIDKSKELCSGMLNCAQACEVGLRGRAIGGRVWV